MSDLQLILIVAGGVVMVIWAALNAFAFRRWVKDNKDSKSSEVDMFDDLADDGRALDGGRSDDEIEAGISADFWSAPASRRGNRPERPAPSGPAPQPARTVSASVDDAEYEYEYDDEDSAWDDESPATVGGHDARRVRGGSSDPEPWTDEQWDDDEQWDEDDGWGDDWSAAVDAPTARSSSAADDADLDGAPHEVADPDHNPDHASGTDPMGDDGAPVWNPSTDIDLRENHGLPPEPDVFVLRSINANAESALLVVADGDLTVGRSANSAELVCDHSDVSRTHCRLRTRNGRWYVSDMESTNGTWVNGQRLPTGKVARLAEGDTVRLGATATFRFELFEDEPQAASPARAAG